MEDEHQDLTTRLNETTSGATTVNIQEVSFFTLLLIMINDLFEAKPNSQDKEKRTE